MAARSEAKDVHLLKSELETLKARVERLERQVTPPSATSSSVDVTESDQVARNQAAIRLIREWMADESGYDEENWPKARALIEANRLSSRKRFGE
jgi:hypothetical protein